MKKFLSVRGIAVMVLLLFIGAGAGTYFGASNFDRLVLGERNFGTDPNTTADLTFQYDEYISNAVDGTLNFGAANLITTGTFGSGVATFTQLSGNITALGNFTVNGTTTLDTLAGTLRATGALAVNGAFTAGALATFAANGQSWALRTVAAGDSVFGRIILNPDTVLVMWNGFEWDTVSVLKRYD